MSSTDYFRERFHLVTHLYEDHELELDQILNYMGVNDEPKNQLTTLERVHILFKCNRQLPEYEPTCNQCGGMYGTHTHNCTTFEKVGQL